jgi:hypothetical protein
MNRWIYCGCFYLKSLRVCVWYSPVSLGWSLGLGPFSFFSLSTFTPCLSALSYPFAFLLFFYNHNDIANGICHRWLLSISPSRRINSSCPMTRELTYFLNVIFQNIGLTSCSLAVCPGTPLTIPSAMDSARSARSSTLSSSRIARPVHYCVSLGTR